MVDTDRPFWNSSEGEKVRVLLIVIILGIVVYINEEIMSESAYFVTYCLYRGHF